MKVVISVLMICVAMLGVSCGRAEQQIELKNALLDDVNDPHCKKNECPEIAYTLVDASGVDLTGKVLEGVVGTSVEWTVKVSDKVRLGRVKIAIKEKPNWMNSRDTGVAGSRILTGKPTEVSSLNSVKIVARDMSRCAALEKDIKNCSSSTVQFDKYDKTFQIKFTIKDNSLPKPSQP